MVDKPPLGLLSLHPLFSGEKGFSLIQQQFNPTLQ